MLRAIVATGIGVMILSVLVTPFFSLPSYSWVSHTTSELGGQHMPAAWGMNFGFATYGGATALAALLAWRQGPFVHSALIVFGLGLIGTAIWSALPISAELGGSMREDQIHSFFASLIGLAFAAAAAARLFGPNGCKSDGLSWLAMIASVAIPWAMFTWPSIDGALQRSMFAISYIFVARQFWSSAP